MRCWISAYVVRAGRGHGAPARRPAAPRRDRPSSPDHVDNRPPTSSASSSDTRWSRPGSSKAEASGFASPKPGRESVVQCLDTLRPTFYLIERLEPERRIRLARDLRAWENALEPRRPSLVGHRPLLSLARRAGIVEVVPVRGHGGPMQHEHSEHEHHAENRPARRARPPRPTRHAPHDMSGHDMSGHVAMYRDRFWLSVLLTIPVLVWSAMIQEWLGDKAPTFTLSDRIRPSSARSSSSTGASRSSRVASASSRRGSPG